MNVSVPWFRVDAAGEIVSDGERDRVAAVVYTPPLKPASLYYNATIMPAASASERAARQIPALAADVATLLATPPKKYTSTLFLARKEDPFARAEVVYENPGRALRYIDPSAGGVELVPPIIVEYAKRVACRVKDTAADAVYVEHHHLLRTGKGASPRAFGVSAIPRTFGGYTVELRAPVDVRVTVSLLFESGGKAVGVDVADTIAVHPHTTTAAAAVAHTLVEMVSRGIAAAAENGMALKSVEKIHAEYTVDRDSV